MSYQPIFNGNAHIDALAMEIAELVGSLAPAAPLVTSPSLHRRLRIRTIRSSLMIEGNTLSEEMVTAVLDGKRVMGNSNDIREVENAARAYALLDELDPYNIDDLLRVHSAMMEGLVAEAGMLRSRNVGVYDGDTLIHAGTPAAYVPEVLAGLFEWLQRTDLHPLLASCIFHYEFEFIHPFADGNGRVGRLWHTLLLAHWRSALAWLPVESVIQERQQDYYASIAASNAAGACDEFVAFMLNAIRDSLRAYVPGGDSEELRRERTLEFFKHNAEATIAELSEFLPCSRRTAERVVAELKRDGLLVREGSARAGRWVVE